MRATVTTRASRPSTTGPLESSALLANQNSFRTTDPSSAVASVRTSVAQYTNVFRPSAIVTLRTSTAAGVVDEDRGGSSITSCTINMLNTILGTGLLALPTVYANAGYISGTLIVVFFGALSTFTNYMFVECALLIGRPTSFATVANRALPGLSVALDIAVIVNCIGTSISYIIVATDGLVHVFGGARQLWTVIAMAIAAPLAFLRNMDSLRLTSLLAVMCIAYITIVIVIYMVGKDAPDDSIIQPCPSSGASKDSCPAGATPLFGSAIGHFSASASLGLAYGAIYATPPIFNEIATPTKGAMFQVGGVAFGIATLLYILVGVCGYATYGDKVQPNILESYPSTPLAAVARIGLSMVTIFSFPIQLLVSRISGLAVWNYINKCRQQRNPGESKKAESELDASVGYSTSVEMSGADEAPSCMGKLATLFISDCRELILTSVFILPALAVALISSDVGVVFSLTGAVGGSLVIMIFPGMMYYRLFPDPSCGLTRSGSLAAFFIGWALLVMGVTFTFVTE